MKYDIYSPNEIDSLISELALFWKCSLFIIITLKPGTMMFIGHIYIILKS